MNDIQVKYILKLVIMILLVLSIIIFIQSSGINFNAKEPPKKLLQVVTIEGLDNIGSNVIIDKNNAFCEHHRGDSNALNNSCNKLTQNNCTSTSCCIWTSNNKCVAGDKNGAVFNSDIKGKTVPLDYYYYENKCYGKGCPVIKQL